MKKIDEIYRGKSAINYIRELTTDNYGNFISENWRAGRIGLNEAVYIDKNLADFADFLISQNKNRSHLDIIKTIKHNRHHHGNEGLVLYLNVKNQLTKTEWIKKVKSKDEMQGLTIKNN